MLFKIEADNVNLDRDDKTFEFESHIVWFNGYFRIDEVFYTNKKAAEYILKHSTDNKIETEIQYCNGVFTCILIDKANHSVSICNDRFGFGEVFYILNNDQIIISSDYWNLVKHLDAPRLNQEAINELLACRFVFGGHTLVEFIEEVLPASIYNFSFFNGSIKQLRNEYWNFKYNPRPIENEEAQKQTFGKLNNIIKVFSSGIIKDGTIGLNITGGIDSRFLLKLLLDNISSENIKSFTYGDAKSEDINIAADVAKVGNIDYSPFIFENPLFDFFKANTIDRMVEKVGHSCYYFQAYGVSKLVPEYNDIDYLVTGADGFFIGLMMNNTLSEIDSAELLTDYIYKANASILSNNQISLIHNKNNSHEQIKKKIYTSLESYQGDEISKFYNWTIKHRLRKYILSIYDVLNQNTQMLLPFYDYEFIDFMAQLPFEQLHNQKAYVNAMCKYSFQDKFSDFRKIEIEKRKITEVDGEFNLVIKSKSFFQKVIDKAFALPDRKTTFRAYSTYKKERNTVQSLLGEALETTSDVIDKTAAKVLIRENNRNERFFMYGLPVILSLVRFENKLKNLNKTKQD